MHFAHAAYFYGVLAAGVLTALGVHYEKNVLIVLPITALVMATTFLLVREAYKLYHEVEVSSEARKVAFDAERAELLARIAGLEATPSGLASAQDRFVADAFGRLDAAQQAAVREILIRGGMTDNELRTYLWETFGRDHRSDPGPEISVRSGLLNRWSEGRWMVKAGLVDALAAMLEKTPILPPAA